MKNVKVNFNIIISVLLGLIMCLFIEEVIYHYYLNSIITLIIFLLTFIISYTLYKKNSKFKVLILSLLILFLSLTMCSFFKQIILEKLNFKIHAEYVEATVLKIKQPKNELYVDIEKFETNKLSIDYSSWGKFKLNNGKIIAMNDISNFLANKGDIVKLIKITYQKGNIKFVDYKPSYYKLKTFKINNKNIKYNDILNDITVIFNIESISDKIIKSIRDYKGNYINFAIYNEEEFYKTILNFKTVIDTNSLYGTKSIIKNETGIFYIYKEEAYTYGIFNLQKSNDYIVITIPNKYLELPDNIEYLESYFKKFL